MTRSETLSTQASNWARTVVSMRKKLATVNCEGKQRAVLWRALLHVFRPTVYLFCFELLSRIKGRVTALFRLFGLYKTKVLTQMNGR